MALASSAACLALETPAGPAGGAGLAGPLLGLAPALVLIAALRSSGGYGPRRARSFGQLLRRLPRCLLLAALLPLSGCALRALPEAERLAAGVVAALAAFLPLRALAYWALGRWWTQRVLVVGAGPLAHAVIAAIETHSRPRCTVIGVVADEEEQPPAHCRVLGCIEELEEVVESVRPHRIVVALTTRRGRMPVGSLLELRVRGMAVEDGAELYERLVGKLAIEALVPSALIFSPECRSYRSTRLFGRGVSLLVALLGLLLAAPLIGAIALLVLASSGRPVFFRHERVGLGGRRFRLLKFRTMRRARRAASEWERDNLDRITRVGRWLRRFRLDELPQFWNVLKGDMNLIGPRPHPMSHLRLFQDRIPYYRLRLAVRPGITGWAQVRYRYANNLEEETEKMRYDLYYIKHQSPWLDLRIAFDTVRVMMRGPEPAAPRAFLGEPTLGVR
jgi:exopolysaccharide biosynthesis polyprenyl glycosylphosphotransferase